MIKCATVMSQDLFQQERKIFFFLPPHVFWDPGWEKIRIRDKHHGSATLNNTVTD
jgi:hypothetical protein